MLQDTNGRVGTQERDNVCHADETNMPLLWNDIAILVDSVWLYVGVMVAGSVTRCWVD